ncbi:MAG: transcription antitermination factor NusB [bacterium]|nr:transcription antitermination factor NusB [bacterium]
MANRHLSRSIAMQTLFEWDFTGYDDAQIKEMLLRNTREFAPGVEDDDDFAEVLVYGVLKKRKKIDSIIEKAAPEWPIEQVARVDRNVLRLGLWELLFGKRDEVPPKVAINEAIELAKNFGGESSGRFVNGVLGTVYKEIGEPGKDDTGKKLFEGDMSKLPVEHLGGGVVYRREGDVLLFALVHDVFGYWTLSKGKLGTGKVDVEKGTARKIREELGIADVRMGEEMGTNEYVASDPEKGKIRKRVTYFLIETKEKELHLKESGGLDDVRWFGQDEVVGVKTYPDIKPLLEKALKILLK